MMLFMSKYSKNIDFFVLIKKIFLMFFGRFTMLYVVMMLFMSKYSKNVDFFVLIKKIFLMFFGRFTML